KILIIFNILTFIATFLFGIIVPIYNPMFAMVAYSNFLEGRDFSIMEVASECRKRLAEFIQFQVNFDISFFSESLKSLSDNAQSQKLYLNKSLIYEIALFSFLYGKQSIREVKQKLAEIEKESPILFQLRKLALLMNIRTLYFIFITLALVLFLVNIGVLDAFLFLPVLISIYVFVATGVSLNPLLNIQKKTVYFFYGIFKDPRYLVELKKQNLATIVTPHLGLGFLGMFGSLILVGVASSIAGANSIYGSLSISFFIIGFGYLVHQIIIKQLYVNQAALSPTSSLGNSEENSMLESTKKYMGVTNNPQQAMRAYFNSLTIFFLIASLPGINFVGAVMLVLTMVHQKIQVLTKEEFEKNGAYKGLLTLAIITFIPFLGTIFGIIGIIYLLVLKKRYKKSSSNI
ncbi:MAG TPA: hypothetical protein PK720_04580, partial [bacterium]|nr:hypothetical protein [bacterium]